MSGTGTPEVPLGAPGEQFGVGGLDENEAQHLFLGVLDASPTATVVFRAGAGIRHVNPACEELFGRSLAELHGQPPEVLVPERLWPVLRQQVARFLAQDPPRPVAWRPDFPGRRKDGTEFPMQYAAVPVPRPAGLYVVVTIYDATVLRESEERAQAESRRYLTLLRLNEAVARAPDVATLYADTCRIAVDVGGFAAAWVAEGSAGRPLVRKADAGLSADVVRTLDETLGATEPRRPSPTRTAVQTERPVYRRDLTDAPAVAPWHASAMAEGFESSASLPLFRGGRAVAALSLVASNPGEFDERTRDLLEGLARTVSLALDSFENQARLERLAHHRRDLIRRLMDVQETDRNRIAADIHDDSVQALAAVDLRLGLVRRRARQQAPELEPALEGMWEVVRSATASLRHLLFSLEAPDVQAGLRASLLEAAEHVLSETPVRLEVQSDDSELPALLLGQALRIVKEALVNVHQHASATRVWIDVNALGTGVEIRVRDDGTGLRPAAGADARGIEAMRERAELSGGRCTVRPGPEERGTEVVLWLPRELQAVPVQDGAPVGG
ncbi:MAG: domain S-box-containing protein [Marmoricola sp.]|nr:domain S-box-containing protein [Marmoricola sp.]